MAARKLSREFLIVFGVLKTAALFAGLGGSVLSLAALIGKFTASGWARVLGASAVAIVLPLLIVDRLLPDDADPAKVRGLPTDVLAVVWLGFSLAFLGFGIPFTGPMLVVEADRQRAAGMGDLSNATYWIAGVRPVASAAPSVTPSATTRPSSDDVAASDAGHGDAGVAAAHRDAAPGRRPERSPAELFRELAPSVVTVRVQTNHGEGGGTGFVIDAQGVIATNHHVIDDATRVQVKLFDGHSVDDVELLAEDRTADLALLRIHTSSPLTPLVLGDSDAVQVGERAISIGNPLGLEHTLTDGLVSARRVWEGRPMIQMSVPVSPGNSGGPLFNMRGEVIGVTTAQVSGGLFGRAQNLNMAVPVSVLRGMIRSEYPGRRRFSEARPGTDRW